MKKGLMLYAAIALLIFIPLLLTFLFGGYGQTLAGHEVPIAFGLMAFSLLLFEIILASRPGILENKTGLQSLYAIHGAAAILTVLTGIIHIAMEIVRVKIGNFAIPTAPLGFLGFLLLLIATLMGILYLSVTFISKSPRLMRRKEGPHKRERALTLHRLSLLAAVLLFGHILSMPPIRENLLFTAFLSFYFVVVLFVFGYAKVKSHRATHLLTCQELSTPDVHKMTFESIDRKPFKYRAGQYVFVRFVASALPKESHPFSMVSAPHAGETSFILMAKESGDYTGMLGQLKPGDQASIEGPYGNFWKNSLAAKDSPLVLLAGGIGITPHLSILQEQLSADPKRPIHLIWGAATLQDTFDLDLFQSMEEENPHFKFHLILSKETHPLYPHGHISAAYLSEIGIQALYAEADFLICGPPGMMKAIRSTLIEKGVEASRIHLEKFSF